MVVSSGLRDTMTSFYYHFDIMIYEVDSHGIILHENSEMMILHIIKKPVGKILTFMSNGFLQMLHRKHIGEVR